MSEFSPDAPHLSANSSLPLHLDCWMLSTSISWLTSFSITNTLIVLPLSTFILHLGYKQWRQQRSVTATTAINHSDVFTFHMVAMEIIAVVGSFLHCVSMHVNHIQLMHYSVAIFTSVWSVKIYFHTLTCVECYLAVNHPHTYRGLKNTGGVKIRNVSIGCVWLLCLVSCALYEINYEALVTIYFTSVALNFVVICFCCLSVLRALRRPGPGGEGGARERVDQSKKKAFHTIVTIMAVLLLSSGGMLVFDALASSVLNDSAYECFVSACAVWLTLPSSLVLPLLFLQRAGKLPDCKR